ncbi:hypothetical protein TNCV_5044111 [Trichonephila clavipes]|uniref:Uncharacterized protein n=1 Tax=Trichonephila clavipes TaxID=2585209 RepID=A0A8X6WJN2_TRICX|nr:hypothetical protein TNCV_5044111 [Trichonephila clavipes]
MEWLRLYFPQNEGFAEEGAENSTCGTHQACKETQSQVTGGRKRVVNGSSNLGLTAGYLTPGFIAGLG